MATWRGTHDGPFFGFEPTGRTVEFRGMVVWRIDEDGRICERHPFIDRSGMAEMFGPEVVTA